MASPISLFSLLTTRQLSWASAIFVCHDNYEAITLPFKIFDIFNSFDSNGIMTSGTILLTCIVILNWWFANLAAVVSVVTYLVFGSLEENQIYLALVSFTKTCANTIIFLRLWYSNDTLATLLFLSAVFVALLPIYTILKLKYHRIFSAAKKPEDILHHPLPFITLLSLLSLSYWLIAWCLSKTVDKSYDIYLGYAWRGSIVFVDLASLLLKVCINTWEVSFIDEEGEEEDGDEDLTVWCLNSLRMTHAMFNIGSMAFFLYAWGVDIFWELGSSGTGMDDLRGHFVRFIVTSFMSQLTEIKDVYKFFFAQRMDWGTKIVDATREDLEHDDTCIVCQDQMVVAFPGEIKKKTLPKKLQCGHLFHKICLRRWFERCATCPTCNKSAF